MEKTNRRVVGIAALGCLGLLLPSCVWSQTLKQVATIDLLGLKGQRFDYLTVDDEDHYLLSARANNGDRSRMEHDVENRRASTSYRGRPLPCCRPGNASGEPT